MCLLKLSIHPLQLLAQPIYNSTLVTTFVSDAMISIKTECWKNCLNQVQSISANVTFTEISTSSSFSSIKSPRGGSWKYQCIYFQILDSTVKHEEHMKTVYVTTNQELGSTDKRKLNIFNPSILLKKSNTLDIRAYLCSSKLSEKIELTSRLPYNSCDWFSL